MCTIVIFVNSAHTEQEGYKQGFINPGFRMGLPLKKVKLKFESSAFAFVCFEISTLLKLEISTLLKLEISCLLLFSEGLKFQALEGLK